MEVPGAKRMNDDKPMLSEADDILSEYCQPNSMVDMGALFFAATEYRSAYKSIRLKLDAIVGMRNDQVLSARMERDHFKDKLAEAEAKLNTLRLSPWLSQLWR